MNAKILLFHHVKVKVIEISALYKVGERIVFSCEFENFPHLTI